ncbi:MAG: hypothetical protein AAB295_02745, partial [Chloroflexota bacterium]
MFGEPRARAAGRDVLDEVFEKLQASVEVMVELRQFLLYRLAVYTAMGAIIVAYWIGVLLLYWLLSKMVEAVAVIFLIAAIAGNWGLFTIARSFLLYAVQAGYVAVLTQALSAGIPPHVNQKDLAKEMVTARFRDVAMLAAVDQLVKGVVSSFSKTIEDMSSWVPIPGMHQLLVVVNAVIGRAVNTIDEAILSLVFMRPEQPTWQTVREGLVLYAGAWQPVLKLSAGLVVLDFLCTPLLFVMLLMVVGMPTMVLFTHMPLFRGLAIVIPFVITYLVRQVILEPLAVTAVVIAFQ